MKDFSFKSDCKEKYSEYSYVPMILDGVPKRVFKTVFQLWVKSLNHTSERNFQHKLLMPSSFSSAEDPATFT